MHAHIEQYVNRTRGSARPLLIYLAKSSVGIYVSPMSFHALFSALKPMYVGTRKRGQMGRRGKETHIVPVYTCTASRPFRGPNCQRGPKQRLRLPGSGSEKGTAHVSAPIGRVSKVRYAKLALDVPYPYHKWYLESVSWGTRVPFPGSHPWAHFRGVQLGPSHHNSLVPSWERSKPLL